MKTRDTRSILNDIEVGRQSVFYVQLVPNKNKPIRYIEIGLYNNHIWEEDGEYSNCIEFRKGKETFLLCLSNVISSDIRFPYFDDQATKSYFICLNCSVYSTRS